MSMKDFDQKDFFSLFVSQSSIMLRSSGQSLSKSIFNSFILNNDNFSFISSITLLKLKFPLADPKVIVF